MCFSLDVDFQRDASQRSPRGPGLWLECQWDQGGACVDHLVSELGSQFVAKVGGANFRNSQTAGSDHQLGSLNSSPIGVEFKTELRSAYLAYAAGLPSGYATRLAFLEQHLNDVVAASVAKQLPFVLLMPGYPVPRDQLQKILWGVAGQG